MERARALGAKGDNLGEGIVLTGHGHVIAFNKVTGFRDGISLVEDENAYKQYSIDIFRNEIDRCPDDGIEADFAMGNVRVYENRLTNCFMGISSQPSLGGPTYFIRNSMYNIVLSPFKLQRSSIGDVGLHNSVVKSGDAFGVFTHDVWRRAYFRNNLFIGGPSGLGRRFNGYDIGDGKAICLPSADESCDFDYDGYGSHGSDDIRGRVRDITFESVQEMRILTTERHGVVLSNDQFAVPIEFPNDPLQEYDPQVLSLKPSSPAVDFGLRIPGINGGFEGKGPDLGALEVGKRNPAYGPGGLKEWLSTNGID